MGSRSPVALAVLGAVLLMASGCGGGEDTPAAPSADDDRVAAGAAAYASHCAECHGADLRGTDAGPSFLSVVYEPGHHPDEAFRQAPRIGVRAHHWEFGDMPPVRDVTDDELEAIIAFVRASQEREGFEDSPPGS